MWKSCARNTYLQQMSSAGEGRGVAAWNVKYPRTPYWPYSPSIGREGGVHPNAWSFVDTSVVVTEKLDGSNTLLHAGKVYGRSITRPSEAKWMAMVKKHHAWKVTEPDVYLYGEDIYGLHSIAYEPVQEERTFYAFALRDGSGAFAPFAELEVYAERNGISVVPVLFRGQFHSVEEIRAFLKRAHGECSELGGEREGVVLRLARGFPASKFQEAVCKSVRTGHVQSDKHWSKNWQPCRIARNPG